MAASFQLPTRQPPILPKSHFLGRSNSIITTQKPPTHTNTKSQFKSLPTAKFNLYEIMGGRGLCNGEENLGKELKRTVLESSELGTVKKSEEDKALSLSSIPEEGFEKELLGLTGGFPGGERGLKRFIELNPPPKKEKPLVFDKNLVKKPKPPELPLIFPGMIAIVKNPSNPFYMYCGIVQRITDGKAGVLFEGGNWDRLITFRLEELERRDKGPPMVSPRSVILEEMVEKSS
ncbi:hypothetical protein F511_00566 [Dorcoceras hygrometricum]|uniref:NAD(P)H-quinone oxidoreductase subunit S, chloroplastic n=1 Tax=Dorcoceras hygrometricum TaxID=472368 RepID=A0A2Z7BBQ8_9LAMI|nr:hypothetical protein F511_00566 [Dorcoceras hygrometricum]